MKNDELREKLNREVEMFLRQGKKIEQLPPAPEEATLPGGMRWWTIDEPELEDEDDDYE
jgi:hypothetical protein